MDEARKEYHRTYNKSWYEKNKEKRKAQLKAYAESHKADNVRRTQKYRDANKEAVYAYGRNYNRSQMGSYRTYKGHATQKKREFLLSPEEFTAIIIQPCAYCGEDAERIGIDRIDNALGYTKENSAPCCKTCNYMKKNHSVETFLTHITKIYVHNQ